MTFPERVKEYPVQRRWDRVRLSTHIKVHRTIHGVVETTDGQAQDLSIGGIGAYVPNTFALDENVTVEFVLPFGQRPIDSKRWFAMRTVSALDSSSCA